MCCASLLETVKEESATAALLATSTPPPGSSSGVASPRTQRRPRPGAIGQRKHMMGEQIAGIEIDEACAELVDNSPAGRDMRRLQRRGDEPDRHGGDAA